MNRSFTRREKVLLCVLAALLVVVGYIALFFRPMQEQIQASRDRQSAAQDQMVVEQGRLIRMQQMQEELDRLKQSGAVPNAEIPTYDNIQNVMVQLNTILSQATEYSLSFQEVQQGEDGMISRPIQMTFVAEDYQTVRSIVDDLYQCWYRCSIEDLSVTAEENLSIRNHINVELSLVFYEKQR